MKLKICLGLLLLLISACSTTKQKLVTTKNTSIKNYITNNYRSSVLYQDYSRVIIMDVIYFDWNLRNLFIEEYSNLHFKNKDELLKQHKAEYNNLYTFFVFVSFQKPRSQLQKEDSQWKFFLKDWSNQEFHQVRAEKLDKNNIYTLFLEKNFIYFDNWVDVYIINTLRNKTYNPTESLQLQLSSIKGKVVTEWLESTIFFQDLQ